MDAIAKAGRYRS